MAYRDTLYQQCSQAVTQAGIKGIVGDEIQRLLTLAFNHAEKTSALLTADDITNTRKIQLDNVKDSQTEKR